MAKDLPYFKFIATEWLTGNIVYEPFDVQGLFINICALYWQREGFLTLSEVEHRYKRKIQIAKLTERFISVNDGFIKIGFLDEQLIERQYVSNKNSVNGKLGGRPTLEKNKAKKSNKEEEKEEEKKRIRKEEEQLFFPFEGEIFLKVWNLLLTQPKWKKKSHSALQASLKKLSEHDEQTAIKMMENTIAGEWQGLFEIKQQNNKQGNTQVSKIDQYRAASEAAKLYFNQTNGE
jgi:hypothetical protein